MFSIKPWVAALGVPPQQFEMWKDQATDLNFITFWCLEKGHLPIGKYLDWAKEHYGLAVLSDDFINEPVPQDFWSRLSGVANWSKEFQPICEWDGVIFVGCVEPRDDIQWSFPVRYVLASPKLLSQLWARHQQVLTPPHKTSPIPEPVPRFEPVAKPDIEPVAHVEPDLSTLTETAAPELPPPPEALPDGIKPEIPAMVFDFSNIKIAGQESTPIPAPAQPQKPPHPIMPEPQMTARSTPPPAPVITSAPAPTMAPQISKSAHLVHDFFPKVKNVFLGAAVFYLAGERMVPLEWTEEFKPVGEPQGLAHFNEPSAFRIVYRTKKPYFGFVVNTPANNAFFKSWGFNEAPASILIQPMVSGSYIIGMLLCLCKTDADARDQLHHAWELGNELVEIIKSQSLKAA